MQPGEAIGAGFVGQAGGAQSLVKEVDWANIDPVMAAVWIVVIVAIVSAAYWLLTRLMRRSANRGKD